MPTPFSYVPPTIGEVFARWTVIKPLAGRRALSRCQCGVVHNVEVKTLRSGRSQSCGCLQREMMVRTKVTHGHSRPTAGGHSPTYRAWASMKVRCTNENVPQWNDYGGRGISICERWFHSFEAFLEDMGERPSPAYSLDRKDNDGNYEPGNCRWATRKEQNENQRKQTHCKRGHELTAANTIKRMIYGVIHRRCRICDNDFQRDRYHAIKAGTWMRPPSHPGRYAHNSAK